MITDILQRNNIKEEDITGWCISQLFSKENEQLLLKMGHTINTINHYIFHHDTGTKKSTPLWCALTESHFWVCRFWVCGLYTYFGSILCHNNTCNITLMKFSLKISVTDFLFIFFTYDKIIVI